MDKFFSETSADVLIQQFNDLGYMIVDTSDTNCNGEDKKLTSIPVNNMLSIPGMKYTSEPGKYSYAMAA
ncbi:MAG: hypothetical protein WCG87_07355 [Bacteroidota bacterium]